MKAVIQRAKSASVSVDSKVVSNIGKGLLVLVGVGHEDTEADVEKMANKLLRLRLFNDGDEMWKKSVCDIDGEILCGKQCKFRQVESDINHLLVSQFTLFGKVKKGTKPDFHAAGKGETSQAIYNSLLEKIRQSIPCGKCGDGVFGAMMDVSLVNDGPVTIQYDTKETKSS